MKASFCRIISTRSASEPHHHRRRALHPFLPADNDRTSATFFADATGSMGGPCRERRLALSSTPQAPRCRRRLHPPDRPQPRRGRNRGRGSRNSRPPGCRGRLAARGLCPTQCEILSAVSAPCRSARAAVDRQLRLGAGSEDADPRPYRLGHRWDPARRRFGRLRSKARGGFEIGAEERLERGDVVAVSPTIGDIHVIANAYDDRPSISIHVYGGNIGAIRRSVFDPVSGAKKPFISGYSNAAVPNLWDRSKG